MPDIEHHSSTSKTQKASVSFLKKALACIGVDGSPKLDISFTGKASLTFRFTNIRVASFDKMDNVVKEKLALDAIPPNVIEDGDLHVAYEYLYAENLIMSRDDQKAFEHDVAASLQTHIDIGTKGKVELRSSTTLSFSSTLTDRVAFACKFGQLVRRNANWYFYPEEGKMGREQTRPFVPARGVVLSAEPGN
jgi:hypothetical protein